MKVPYDHVCTSSCPNGRWGSGEACCGDWMMGICTGCPLLNCEREEKPAETP